MSARIILGVVSGASAIGVALLLCAVTGRDFAAVIGVPLDWPVIVLAVGAGLIGAQKARGQAR